MERDAYSYRADANVPLFPDDRPILVFDGKCVLCSRFVQFVLRHDKMGEIRLLAAQTPLGMSLYRHYDLDAVDYETNLLLANGRIWTKSESSIRTFELLGFPWSLLGVLRFLPLAVRDRLYEVVARNRLRWFGERTECYLPDTSVRDRFVA